MQFSYKDVNQLTCDDMLVFSIPQYVKDHSNLTPEDCYFYGIVLGDGCLNNVDKNGYISLHEAFRICLGLHSISCVKSSAQILLPSSYILLNYYLLCSIYACWLFVHYSAISIIMLHT